MVVVSLPQFQEFKRRIRENPALLQTVLAQLSQTNPDLVQYIAQHPQEFIQLLSDDGDDGPQFGGDDQDPNQGPQRQHTIQVTQEEKEQIERLVGLGFDRTTVLQAWLACDRNEALAANLLFSWGADEQEQPEPQHHQDPIHPPDDQNDQDHDDKGDQDDDQDMDQDN
ncbi:rad23 nucleotide excision repair protein a [Anaeramoeba ignava]|uniref:UV excision repair protein RAD23 n=1 Tax=Anaeramoeba ignava TaxID=1746090 RepID=A0A9Q0RJ48_ANAIG|nr:rad23 nucleotide excision repair protein a [Anaeramoeba ignava]